MSARRAAALAGAAVAALATATLVALAALGALGGSGRGGGEDAARAVGDRTGAALPAFTALVWRSRPDEAAGGRLQVKLLNESDGPVTVTSVRILSPAFEPTPASAADTTFRPGEAYDLRTGYGRARCDAGVDAEPAEAEVTVAGSGSARAVTVRVPVAAQDDILRRVHDEECTRVALLRALSVELVVTDTSGSGTVRLTRREPGVPLTVTGLDGSILYALTPDDGAVWPLELPPASSPVDVPLRVAPATCDGHRIGESKKPFVFPAWVSLDGAAPAYLAVTVPDTTRANLQTLLKATCSAG